MEIQNPFEDLFKRLDRIESYLLEIKDLKPLPIEPDLEFLTRKKTAKLLDISLPTLNSWTKKGAVPALRIQDSVRYRKEDVINSLEEVRTLKYKRG
tara:strand:- start:826 stop:1113 length:288 start_codon:yes stop_codon:yes gene_type:complete